MLCVTLADRDGAHELTLDLELGIGKHLGQYGSFGQFAWEPRRPIQGLSVAVRFERRPSGHFPGREPAGVRKVIDQSRQAEPVVGVSVCDVDAGNALLETFGPLCQGVSLIVGQQSVYKDRLSFSRDQRAAHRRPGWLIAGSLRFVACVRPSRRDEDVYRQRTDTYLSFPCSESAESLAISARAAATSSSFRCAWPHKPQ